MDYSIQRLLHDKLYDKRKQGALELELIVREAVFKADHEKVAKIVEQLCHDYAYAVHQPHARNGGLIGLAAASIALGYEGVAPYLKEIVPPVLACFTDPDARVRYYACESMYNIAKVAKGEILPFFNDIFDALAKLASDIELSVKNGAELLDRLVKDIVAESAASYVSVLQLTEKSADADPFEEVELPTAFSLERFIPLLKERIHVIVPFTRNFLVSWLTLLDTIPDLELISYLPEFLEGLIKFLGGPDQDVNVATQGLLERFLQEIRRITRLKKGIEESRKSQSRRRSVVSDSVSVSAKTEQTVDTGAGEGNQYDIAVDDAVSESLLDDDLTQTEGDWIPGQDVQIDFPKILEILVSFIDPSYEEAMQVEALRWIDSFFEFNPEDILPFVPTLLTQVLPAMSSDVESVRQEANRVNKSLLEYIYTLSDDTDETAQAQSKAPSVALSKESTERKSSETNNEARKSIQESSGATPRSSLVSTPFQPADLDYAAAVNSLTLQFLNENETTRVAALSWLIMLHRKTPRKVVAFNDGTFPALLKTLSDPAEAVVTKDLQLLSQISRNSEDSYFASFMVNLLQLFSTDRHLLEVRGNLIIRQLCLNLSPERIYRTLADCLEKEEDLEFASIMVQNLNNNLITAPELSDMRKRLRNQDSREGQMFFVALFRSWCHNAVSTFSLCLLAQAYEQAYNLLQIFAELEMTVNMLIQIDKLVQLLESPVFTCLFISYNPRLFKLTYLDLRLQLLEPEKYPYLYKCLYGVLMLLPQSSAFAALKNRLNSVSNIGFLHGAPRSTTQTAPSYERPTGTRLKGREENSIRWGELLDKFKAVQERARRSQAQQRHSVDLNDSLHPSLSAAISSATAGRDRSGLPDIPRGGPGMMSPGAGLGLGVGPSGMGANRGAPESSPKAGSSSSILGAAHKHKSSLPNLGSRLGIGSRKSKKP